MATRGGIIVKDSSGKYWPAYVHFDCFPKDMRRTLAHYPTEEKALELVKGGDMSSLDTTIETTEYYVRDRGEDIEDVGPRSYDTEREAIGDVNQRGGNNCIMLFEDGKWEVVQ